MLSTNKTNELNELTTLTGDEYVVIQTAEGPFKVKVSTLLSGTQTDDTPADEPTDP